MQEKTFLKKVNVKALSGIKHYFAVITPQIAEMLLSDPRRAANRSIRRAHIDEYVRAIKNGMWDQFNGMPIILDDNGCLLDGQHRCAAVIATGEPIITLVVEGVKKESIHTVDIPQIRSAENCISLMGVNVVKNVAAIAKAKLMYDNGRKCGDDSGSNNKVSKPEIVDEVVKNVEFYNYIAKVAAEINEKSGKAFTIGEIGGIYAYLVSIGHTYETVNTFFDLMCAGEYGTPYRCALLKLAKLKHKGSNRAQVWITIWNTYLLNKNTMMRGCVWFR
jgi:hypothetical protein